MALTSHELGLGTPCPSFTLPSVDGKTYSLSDFSQSKALLVAFICSHCPYVRAIEDDLLALAHGFEKADLQVVAICSNDAEKYPEDAPGKLLLRWHEKNYGFPYLVDSSQDVAKAFDAACTPDLFLYDAERKLYYHGRVQELESAVVGILTGKLAPENQQHSIGCSIKWYTQS
ncbi:MAG: thioredoxin family protein [Myxococcaceae bacterium]